MNGKNLDTQPPHPHVTLRNNTGFFLVAMREQDFFNKLKVGGR